eukprot:CAMPEP_0113709728 /NCGR_PEP_ID=MMETSP0038_2-20120614/29741_1 /TAXON_ID=2898 /ORGANISM="Cryptomonas paramecium" /LENGTH=98 /DNA_ID=CAMNT_0000635663 /DNA_START=300 /DNA_END=593 /DNA_ORIENTATION=+ /assembly_acc=CAM_ASM_000170
MQNQDRQMAFAAEVRAYKAAATISAPSPIASQDTQTLPLGLARHTRPTGGGSVASILAQNILAREGGPPSYLAPRATQQTSAAAPAHTSAIVDPDAAP